MTVAIRNQHTVELLDMRIVEVHRVAADLRSFILEPLETARLAPAEPGAHVDVHLPDGIVRQYSLMNPDPAPDAYRIAVKLDPASRGGSRQMMSLVSGDVLKVGAPRNNFRLDESGSHYVLLAGGIGITPIVSMARQLEREGKSWELYYACRERSYAALLGELGGSPRVHVHVDSEVGTFMNLRPVIAAAPTGSQFYCCGPASMLGAYEDATRHLPSEKIHLERFVPVEDVGGNGFHVALARSGKEVFVPPGQTILGVLSKAGIKTTSSCRLGICGTCETGVLSGIPDHKDSFLTAEEKASNSTVMICCSGCKGDRLVLDL